MLNHSSYVYTVMLYDTEKRKTVLRKHTAVYVLMLKRVMLMLRRTVVMLKRTVVMLRITVVTLRRILLMLKRTV